VRCSPAFLPFLRTSETPWTPPFRTVWPYRIVPFKSCSTLLDQTFFLTIGFSHLDPARPIYISFFFENLLPESRSPPFKTLCQATEKTPRYGREDISGFASPSPFGRYDSFPVTRATRNQIPSPHPPPTSLDLQFI